MTGYALGYIFGRLLCLTLVFLLPLVIAGLVQFSRTRDHNQALRAAIRWWVVGLGLFLAALCCIASTLGNAVQRLDV